MIRFIFQFEQIFFFFKINIFYFNLIIIKNFSLVIIMIDFIIKNRVKGILVISIKMGWRQNEKGGEL